MGTLIVGAVVGCIIGLAVYNIYKDSKRGKGCGCGCESCSYCPGGRKANSVKHIPIDEIPNEIFSCDI